MFGRTRWRNAGRSACGGPSAGWVSGGCCAIRRDEERGPHGFLPFPDISFLLRVFPALEIWNAASQEEMFSAKGRGKKKEGRAVYTTGPQSPPLNILPGWHSAEDRGHAGLGHSRAETTPDGHLVCPSGRASSLCCTSPRATQPPWKRLRRRHCLSKVFRSKSF